MQPSSLRDVTRLFFNLVTVAFSGPGVHIVLSGLTACPFGTGFSRART